MNFITLYLFELYLICNLNLDLHMVLNVTLVSGPQIAYWRLQTERGRFGDQR